MLVLVISSPVLHWLWLRLRSEGLRKFVGHVTVGEKVIDHLTDLTQVADQSQSIAMLMLTMQLEHRNAPAGNAIRALLQGRR